MDDLEATGPSACRDFVRYYQSLLNSDETLVYSFPVENTFLGGFPMFSECFQLRTNFFTNHPSGLNRDSTVFPTFCIEQRSSSITFEFCCDRLDPESKFTSFPLALFSSSSLE